MFPSYFHPHFLDPVVSPGLILNLFHWMRWTYWARRRSSFEVEIFSWSHWEDYRVSGLGRMFYSGQAKLFTTILRNCQTTKCQEFWSNITEYSWRNQDWNVLESRRNMRGAGAVGDKFYRVQESKYPIEGFVRWKDRRVVKMRDSIGNISISSNWKYFRGIFQSKPKPLEEQ